MFTKKLVSLSIVAALLVFTISSGVIAEEPSLVSVSTGGTGGTYYPLGTAIAEILDANIDGVIFAAESTGGSVENARFLQAKESEIGFVETLIGEWAYTSTGQYFEGEEPATNIRGFISLYPNLMQTVVKADSDIESYSDLKGKNVAVGMAGGSSPFNMQVILEAYGLSFDDINPEYLSFGDAMDPLRDDRIDAVLVDASPPSSAIIDINAMHDIRILDIDEDLIRNLTEEYPHFASPTIIPEGRYEGIGEIVTTGSVAGLHTRAELSEDFVYELTKTIFENQEEIESRHAAGRHIVLEDAVDGFAVPMHEGAMRYYREMGIVD